MPKSPIKPSDLFRYYKGLPHQMAAVKELEALLLKQASELFERDQEWFKTWSQAGKQQDSTVVKVGSSFGTYITPNFTLGEFAIGDPKRKFVRQYQIETAKELATFLEQVRSHFGNRRITITSGYRPPEINRMVGGASSSEHLFDAPGVGAVDFYVDGANIFKVQEYVDSTWPCSVGYGANKGFVHLGVRRGRPRVRWDY